MGCLDVSCGCVQALLARGASLEAANRAGITALIGASFFGHDPVVQLLLQRGANARAVDIKRRSALHWAALNDNELVRLSILYLCYSLALFTNQGASWTPAHAGTNGEIVRVQTVRSLLGWAADALRLLDESGASPLDLARQADAAHVMSILGSLK